MWVNYRMVENVTPLTVLYEQMAGGRVSMSIGIDVNLKLTCSPFATHTLGANRATITGLDLSAAAGKWIHLSCTWNAATKRIDFNAVMDQKEYTSFFLVQDDKEGIQKSDVFTGSLFNSFQKDASSLYVGFRELRVWQTYRTKEQLALSRYSAVNPEDSVAKEGLRVYFRFSSGLKRYRNLAQEVWYGHSPILSSAFTLESFATSQQQTVCSAANFY